MFEAAKGALVLAAGFGLLSLLHRDLQALAERLVQHSHLNPAHHYPQIFIQAASRMNDARLVALAGLAFLYSTLRFVEAYGLWRMRPWAEWLAIVAGSAYLPVEVYEIVAARDLDAGVRPADEPSHRRVPRVGARPGPTLRA